MKNRIITALLILFFVAAAFAASFVGARWGAAGSPEAAAEEEQPLNATENIALAGYDSLRLLANQTEQQVYFYNSEKNQCFIIISIILDGKQIYTSQMIAPNTKIESIKLSDPLAAGIYNNAVLRYSCYDLYTQRELNGAEMAIKLEVE